MAATALFCALIAVGVGMFWYDAMDGEIRQAREEAAKAQRDYLEIKKAWDDVQQAEKDAVKKAPEAERKEKVSEERKGEKEKVSGWIFS
jgi:hypothetical protein